MSSPFWIEKAWGDQVDDATMEDIRVVIQETINMDEEHGAFWVGNNENENVLEIHKNLNAFYIFNGKEQLVASLHSWQEIEHLFKLFFERDFDEIEKVFVAKKVNNSN